MKKTIKISIICVLLMNIANLYADSTTNFDLEKFLSADKTSDFIDNYRTANQYGGYGQDELRLFSAQKSTRAPFNSLDLNEADEFLLAGASGYSIFFNRNYKITGFAKFFTHVNHNMQNYELGNYPLNLALHNVVSQCSLKNESLTNFSINRPTTRTGSIVYIFTTKNSAGKCSQSLFDTYQKTIDCKVMTSSCYID